MNKDRHRMAVAAHLVLRDRDGRVLFIRRANTGYADGQWTLPAGHVDPGETVVEACVRETAEELRITIRPEALAYELVQHKCDFDGEERIDFFFAADLPEGQHPSVGEPDKCDAQTWAAIDQPPTPLIPYIRAALNGLTASPKQFLTFFGFASPRNAPT